jgi:hypothetical protein
MFFVRLDGRYPAFVSVIALHLDYCFRTDNSAHSAPCTVSIICLGGEIAGFIRTLGYDDAVLRADYYTKPTTFAPLSIDYYFACHLLISFNCSLQGLQIPFGEFKQMDFNSDECFCKGKRVRPQVF